MLKREEEGTVRYPPPSPHMKGDGVKQYRTLATSRDDVGGVVARTLAVGIEQAVDSPCMAQQQLVVRPAAVLLVLPCTAQPVT
jgi:hypothetical protein